MVIKARIRSLWRNVVHRDQADQELDEEVRTYLEHLVMKKIGEGMRPEEAQRSARISFGGVEQVKEEVRAVRAGRFLEDFARDVRYGLRQLLRNPGFSATAITIAALGIAATCVVFAFADAATFRALPYQNASRLAAVTMADLKNNPNRSGVSVPVFLNWSEHAGKIGRFAAIYSPLKSKSLAGGREPMQVFDKQISPGSLKLLGASPLLGRDFLASDYRASGTDAVILSYSLWQQLFHSSPGAVGRAITLDGVGYTIVGIMPPNFLLPESSAAMEPACWTPLVFNAKQKSAAKDHSLTIFTRLGPGTSPEQAEVALRAIALPILNPTGARNRSEWRIQVTPLIRELVHQWRSILIFLFGAAGFLLAIACANVANLLLARANGRQNEIAVRAAIGASRGRVIRQLLTESAALGGVAGALGILLAHWGIEWERSVLPQWFQTANFEQMGIDPRILAATVAVSFVVGIVFGLAPAIHVTRIDLVESLKQSSTSVSLSKGRWNAQGVAVVVEIAFSLVLLTGVALMLRSFLKLEAVHPGFDPDQMLTMRVLMPKYRYPKPEDQIAAYQQVIQKIRVLPGVTDAAFVTPLPMAGINGTVGLPAQPGMSNAPANSKLGIGFHVVSTGYFNTMGIQLLRGRLFTLQDTHDSELVAIVDEAFVDRFWPGEDPVGKVFYPDYPKMKPVVHVVGEVDSVRDLQLWERPRPELYNPFTQHFFAAFAGSLVIKTRTPASTAVAVQQAIHSVDPEAPVSRIETMRDVLSLSLAEKRLYLWLVGVFATLALLLATAGIASTVSYAISRRKHEIGIRMALGARRSSVLFLMLGQTARLVLVGIVLGAAGSLLLTRFISSQLYGISPTDPLTFVSVALFLGLVSLFASIIPATRAASVDPAETLRTT
ncbi:MAG: ABC transporter permease [Acidobacteria bacterium]|nr:MAG: ABC transporter permease [Acidobacteriota bacterium]